MTQSDERRDKQRPNPAVWFVVAALVAVAIGLLATRRAAVVVTPEILADFNAGVGSIEQYRYDEAYRRFKRVVDACPNAPEAWFNLALTAWNRKGLADATRGKDDSSPDGEAAVTDFMAVAEKGCRRALDLEPDLLHARFLLGLVHHRAQRIDEAVEAFGAVARGDPRDPFALYWYGKALEDSGQLPEAVRTFERVVELQPAFGSAYWRLSQLYRRVKQPDKAKAVLERFKEYRSAREEVVAGEIYAESGQYLSAIRTIGGVEAAPTFQVVERRLTGTVGAAPVVAKRPDGELASPGRAAGDLDGDSFLDIVLCGQPGDGGGASAAEIWLGGKDGVFRRSHRLAGDGATCGLGDVDGDSDLDLVLADAGRIELLLNDGTGRFAAGDPTLPPELPGFPVRVLVLDADSDWDLDVVVLCQVRDGERVAGRLVILNNNRDGTFEDVASRAGVAEIDVRPVDLLFGDVDGDIDQDLVLVDGDRGAVRVLVNERLWRYRAVDVAADSGLGGARGVRAELDSAPDGRSVLRLFSEAMPLPVTLVRDASEGFERVAEGTTPRAYDSRGPAEALEAPARDGRPRTIVFSREPGAAPVMLSGDAPDSWIAFDLNGPDKPIKDRGGTWSNLSGVGATLEVCVGPHHQVRQVNGLGGGASRAAHRVFFQLPDGTDSIDYVRVLWPDGVLQTEIALAARRVHRIEEMDRKPTSCPLLFAWDGERFRYIGDFLGVGGLGYFEVPGFYGKPDPTELMEIPALAPRPGPDGTSALELRITEPLEECTYLDRVRLLAADHPADVTVHPDEMFAVMGPVPQFDLVAYRHAADPERVTDQDGHDVTRALLEIDREYAEGWPRDPRFPGVAARDHAIVLDFGDRLAGVLGEGRRPVLLLYGYVEYGYSTSNFAASQARLDLRAPTVSVERDGEWVTLREQWGFPAGTPRWMAVDLDGLLRPGDRRVRVRTNMEIYWDRALVAGALAAPGGNDLRTTTLAARRADLRDLGFPRDGFFDGKRPRLHDYHDVVPTDRIVRRLMKSFPGRYTRYGDVAELLEDADDRFVLFGPGDEVAVSFDPAELPPLPDGWRRTFFMMAEGWCKDTDLYTAFPESVEPLPFRAMEGYPPPERGGAAAERYEDDPARAASAAKYHTRRIEPIAVGDIVVSREATPGD